MGIPIVSELVSIAISQPWIAWAFVFFLMIGDTFLSISLNFGGIFGTVLNETVKFVSGGHDLHITSGWILLFLVLFPVAKMAWDKGKSP